MEKAYADALELALKNGADEGTLVEGLVAHLAREGRTKLLPGILRELKRKEERAAKLSPRIEAATEHDRKEALAQAKALGIEAKEVAVNHDLISGWRARSGGTLIDRSGKQALIDIYKNIVTN